MKCLCPCPDYISVPIEHGLTKTIVVDWPGVEFLHGKKSDRECYRCGVDLCGDCATNPNKDEVLFGYFADDLLEYCPGCAKELTQ